MSSKDQSNLFGRITGGRSASPEQCLDKAHESALNIEAIEKQYFNGGRVVGNANVAFPQEVFGENLKVLKQSLKAFNSKQSDVVQLSQDYMMKAIFAEGVLAKYASDQPNSALVPSTSTGIAPSAPQNSPSPENNISVIDVRSIPTEKLIANQNALVVPQKKVTKVTKAKAKPAGEKQSTLPRSLQRTINKISNDFDPDSEKKVIETFRRSREKTVIALRLLALLMIVPLATQVLTKNLVILPAVAEFRASAPPFINIEMKEEAFEELSTFEESLKLHSLVHPSPELNAEVMEEQVKEKAIEIKEDFLDKSNRAISNVFADIVSLLAFTMVLLLRRSDIAILKAFVSSIISGLSDGAKAFAIILSTDLSVGFHSPHGWDVLLESLATHLGLAANHSGISLFIATVPVIADTGIKYWIFRSLSRISPSTVATFKEMSD